MAYDLKFQQANIGREFWLKNHIDNYDYVLLLIDSDKIFNKKLLDCFQKKLEQDGKYGMVISTDKELESERLVCLQAPSHILAGILQLYSMYEFTDRIIIGSTTKPYGNTLGNLFTLNNISQTQILEQVLFQTRGEHE